MWGDSMATFAERIKQLRIEAGLSQEELAEARATIDELYVKNDRLQADLKYANKRIALLEDEVMAWKHKYEEDMAAEKLRHQQEVEQLNTEHAQKVATLIEQHNNEIEQLNKQHAEEIEQINIAHAQEIEQLNNVHAEEIAQIKQAHADEILKLKQEHEQAVQKIKDEHRAQLEELHARYQSKLKSQAEMYENRIVTIHQEHQKEVKALNATIDKIKADSEEAIKLRDYVIDTERRKYNENMTVTVTRLNEAETNVEELTNKYQVLNDMYVLSNARLTAIRSEYGLIKENEDFATKEMADELEGQFQVFRKFRNKQWQITKKRIIDEVFSFFKEKEQERIKKKQEKDIRKKIAKNEQPIVPFDNPFGDKTDSLISNETKTDYSSLTSFDDDFTVKVNKDEANNGLPTEDYTKSPDIQTDMSQIDATPTSQNEAIKNQEIAISKDDPAGE